MAFPVFLRLSRLRQTTSSKPCTNCNPRRSPKRLSTRLPLPLENIRRWRDGHGGGTGRDRDLDGEAASGLGTTCHENGKPTDTLPARCDQVITTKLILRSPHSFTQLKHQHSAGSRTTVSI